MSKNDITGDNIVSRVANRKYRDNYDEIFGQSESNPELDALYDRARYELATQGLVSTITMAQIVEAGGDAELIVP